MRDLRELLDPTRIGNWIEAAKGMSPIEAEAALVTVAAMEKALSLRVSADPASAKVQTPASGDRLLTAVEAAERLGVTERWLRGRARLPFRVKLSERNVRYSEAGIQKHLLNKLRAQSATSLA